MSYVDKESKRIHDQKVATGHRIAKSNAMRKAKKAPTFKELMKQNPRLKPDGKGNLSYK